MISHLRSDVVETRDGRRDRVEVESSLFLRRRRRGAGGSGGRFFCRVVFVIMEGCSFVVRVRRRDVVVDIVEGRRREVVRMVRIQEGIRLVVVFVVSRWKKVAVRGRRSIEGG